MPQNLKNDKSNITILFYYFYQFPAKYSDSSSWKDISQFSECSNSVIHMNCQVKKLFKKMILISQAFFQFNAELLNDN